MDPEDFVSPEVGITAAVVAAVASSRVRKVARRGAVLGVAGALMAGDAITSFARGFGQGISHGAQRFAEGTSAATEQVAEHMRGAQNSQDASNASASDGERPVHQDEM